MTRGIIASFIAILAFGCTAEPPMTGALYFELAINSITSADIEFQRINELDKQDASALEINVVIDSCIAKCDVGVVAMNEPQASELEFPLSEELRTKTIAWLESLKSLCINHLKPMAEAMAKPEDVWSEQDFNAFFEYGKAYEEFQAIDADWVAFQNDFGAQNDLTFTGTINMDELVEETN